MIDNKKQFEIFNMYEEAKKNKGTVKPRNPYTLFNGISWLKSIIDELKFFDPNKHRDPSTNLISASSLITEFDENLLWGLGIIATFSRGSILGRQTEPKAINYATLTPICLYAYKLQGINYEEWDKSDPVFIKLCGKSFESLLEFLQYYPEPIDFDIEQLRADANVKDSTTWGTTRNVFIDTFVVRNYTILHKILMQTWIANSTHRVPGVMVLDPWNWDNVPKAHDSLAQQNLPEAESNSTKVGGLPW